MAIVNGEPGFTQLTKLNVIEKLFNDSNPVISSTVIPVDSSMVIFDGVTGEQVKSAPVVVDALGNMTFTALSDNTNAMNPITVIDVFTADDIDGRSEVVSNVWTITSNIAFVFKVPGVEFTTRFVLDSSGARARLDFSGYAGFMFATYNGSTGTLISGQGDFSVSSMGLVDGTAASTFLNTDSGIISIMSSLIRLWSDLGTHQRGDFVTNDSRFAAWVNGFKLIDNRVVSITSVQPISDPANSILFETVNTLTDNQVVEVSQVSGTLQATTSLLRVDPGARDSTRIGVSSCTLASGNLFDEAGADGTFTAVSDQSVSATNITSVTDSGGLARFNFTPGPTVFVGQQFINTTFSTPDYNGTLTATAVGSGFFETDSVAFDGDDTGSFTSNSVQLTDTATTLSDGDTINVDTDLSTDYDGGTVVYNQQTNSFEISRPFNVTATGSWSTRGLAETNPKVTSVDNPNFPSSKILVFGELNGNSTGTTILDGTYGAVNSTGLSQNPITQRFKLIDVVNNIFELTSNEDFSEIATVNIFASKAGATVNYRFTLSINGAVPVFATASYAPMEVKTTTVQASLLLPLSMVLGDTFQVMVAGDGTTDSLTISDLFIT